VNNGHKLERIESDTTPELNAIATELDPDGRVKHKNTQARKPALILLNSHGSHTIIMKDFVLRSFRLQAVTGLRSFVKIRKHLYQNSHLPTPRTQSF
jgi:hypothetical protein